jgi:hypothetical protein
VNYSTIHELPVLTPSFSVAVLAESELSPGYFQTGQINLYSAIGTALDEALSSGYLTEIRTRKIYTAFGDSDTWTRTSLFFAQNSATFVTKDFLQANYLALTGGTIQSGLMDFGDIRASRIYTDDGLGSRDWNETTTYVREFSTVRVFEHNSDLVFTNEHHGKAHHFNTPLNSSYTLTIPTSVNNGFNAIIMNTGEGKLVISSANFLATGTEIETRYSGAFIYKDNNVVYAAGNIT